jgi:hypothetical protein
MLVENEAALINCHLNSLKLDRTELKKTKKQKFEEIRKIKSIKSAIKEAL